MEVAQDVQRHPGGGDCGRSRKGSPSPFLGLQRHRSAARRDRECAACPGGDDLDVRDVFKPCDGVARATAQSMSESDSCSSGRVSSEIAIEPVVPTSEYGSGEGPRCRTVDTGVLPRLGDVPAGPCTHANGRVPLAQAHPFKKRQTLHNRTRGCIRRGDQLDADASTMPALPAVGDSRLAVLRGAPAAGSLGTAPARTYEHRAGLWRIVATSTRSGRGRGAVLLSLCQAGPDRPLGRSS